MIYEKDLSDIIVNNNDIKITTKTGELTLFDNNCTLIITDKVRSVSYFYSNNRNYYSEIDCFNGHEIIKYHKEVISAVEIYEWKDILNKTFKILNGLLDDGKYCSHCLPVVIDYDSLEEMANDKNLSVDKLIEDILKKETEKYKNNVKSTYIVKSGDTLMGIAKKLYGNSSWKIIYDMNRDKIKNPNVIFPNMVLKVPKYIKE